jgi:hypothetical protein
MLPAAYFGHRPFGIAILTRLKLSLFKPVSGRSDCVRHGVDIMMKLNSPFARISVIALTILGLAGCSNMDENQQRMVSGGAIGIAAGAVTTAVTGGCIACGMAVGGAVGSAGGYLIGKLDESTRSSGSSASISSTSTTASNSGSYNNGVPQGYPPGGYGQ